MEPQFLQMAIHMVSMGTTTYEQVIQATQDIHQETQVHGHYTHFLKELMAQDQLQVRAKSLNSLLNSAQNRGSINLPMPYTGTIG